MTSLSKGGEVMWNFWIFWEARWIFGELLRRACFWFNWEFLSFKKGEKFSFGFLSTMCTFVRSVLFTTFCFYFSKHQTFLMRFANVFIKGEIVRSKCVLILILWWTIGICDYWFWYWSLLSKWFWMIGFTGAVILCGPVRPGGGCRLDRLACGLTGRRYVGFGFGLFVWISEFISWLWLLDGYYTYVILLFAANESS